CWRLTLKLLYPQRPLQCLYMCIILSNSCRVHVHNVQVCYICILVPCWCAAPINSSFTIKNSFDSI
uniref:Uncharacterized protein n=1 Tax=Macaca fascicularis TaxID=9541 RepID=A0A7N9CDZ2_MACFA